MLPAINNNKVQVLKNKIRGFHWVPLRVRLFLAGNSQYVGKYTLYRASLVAQRLKRLPAMWETPVRSLGQEDPLEKEIATHSSMEKEMATHSSMEKEMATHSSMEKEMATHSSILAWRVPWTEEPGRLQSTGSQRVGHD